MQEFEHEVFISYSHKDAAWVKQELFPRLEEARIDYHYDGEFEPGRFSTQNIRDAIQKSRQTILVLSPNWAESDWTTFEGELIQYLDLLGTQGRIIPVMIESCQLPLDMAARSYIDLRPGRLKRADFEAQMARLIGSIRSDARLAPRRMSMLPSQHGELLAPPSSLAAERSIWISDTRIRLRDDVYELLTSREQISESEAEDRGSVVWQAPARLLDQNKQYPMVWLKQVVRQHESRSAKANFQALRTEYALLDRLSHIPYPRSAAFYEQDDTLTLVYKYPLDETSAKPARTLAQHYGLSSEPLDSYSIQPFLRSLLPLFKTLEIMHNAKPARAHRMLAPTSIFIVAKRPGPSIAVLRDLGLAAFSARRGEGPEGYQAPEQLNWGEKARLPGPETDVYQLAAILYRVLTGLSLPVPTPQVILSPSAVNGQIPVACDEILLRALSVDKENRPRLGKFASELRRVINQMQ